MIKTKVLALAIASSLSVSASVSADSFFNGFNFKELDSSANAADWDQTAPWKIPKNFTQSVVSDETDLNIYDGGRDDWPDMNTVNETGKKAGRYMYRTHEVRSGETYGAEPNGAVSVVDLKTGKTKILAQDPSYNALDGIRWTPWGTILFAEETEGGRLFEIKLKKNNLMKAKKVLDRPAVGRIAHEGIDVDDEGNVYVVDEHRGRTSGCDGLVPCGGGIYKFVPDTYGDLSSGNLYVLKVNGADGIGKAEWVGPIDASDARRSGSEWGGQSYQRPEDLEIIGDKLYVAITEGPRDTVSGENGLEFTSELYEGRVIALDMNTMEVTNFVKPGVNVPVEIGKPGDENFQTGFDSIDNLAEAPNGDLVIVEDNKPSDIWFAKSKTNAFGASKKVKLFASLTDPGAEATGIYFSPLNPSTLYVNIQHSAAEDGDGTWAITKK